MTGHYVVYNTKVPLICTYDEKILHHSYMRYLVTGITMLLLSRGSRLNYRVSFVRPLSVF